MTDDKQLTVATSLEPPTLSPEQFMTAIDHADSVVTAITLAAACKKYLKDRKLVTAADYAVAAEWLARIKGAQAGCEATRTSITVPLNDLLRAINARVGLASDPLGESKHKTGHEFALKRLMLDYNNEQERLRRVEQDRLNAIAAAEQRKANEAAAEARRKAEADAAALRKQAEEAAAAGRAAEAARLAARADTKIEKAETRAEQLELRAATTVAPVVTAQVPKVAGLSTSLIWKWRILKPLEIKRECLIPDEVMIGRLVKAMGKGAESIVGGIEAYQEQGMASRGK